MALLLRCLLRLRLSAAHGECLHPRSLAGILLTLLHLLAELLCLLLIRKAQSGQTAPSPAIVQLKGMKEGPVLIPSPILVYLLVPDNTTIRWGDIHQLHPESVPHKIVCQHSGALQAGVGPSRAVRICNVQLGHGYRLDLVGLFGNGAFDRLFVFFSQNRRHSAGDRCVLSKHKRVKEVVGCFFIVMPRAADVDVDVEGTMAQSRVGLGLSGVAILSDTRQDGTAQQIRVSAHRNATPLKLAKVSLNCRVTRKRRGVCLTDCGPPCPSSATSGPGATTRLPDPKWHVGFRLRLLAQTIYLPYLSRASK